MALSFLRLPRVLIPLALLLAGGRALVVLATVLLLLGSLAMRFLIIRLPHASAHR